MKIGELRRRLAREWGSEGWQYDLTTVAGILSEIERTGKIDPSKLAGEVGGGFLKREGVTRADVEEAIERAIGGEVLTPEDEPERAGITIKAGGDVHFLQIDKSEVHGSVVQGVEIDAGGSTEEVLAAVGALVVSGLKGEWNPGLAQALSSELDGRDDVDRAQLEQAVIEAGKEAAPEKGRIEELIEKVATSSASSLLTSALTSGLTQLGLLLFS